MRGHRGGREVAVGANGDILQGWTEGSIISPKEPKYQATPTPVHFAQSLDLCAVLSSLLA